MQAPFSGESDPWRSLSARDWREDQRLGAHPVRPTEYTPRPTTTFQQIAQTLPLGGYRSRRRPSETLLSAVALSVAQGVAGNALTVQLAGLDISTVVNAPIQPRYPGLVAHRGKTGSAAWKQVRQDYRASGRE